MAYQKTLELISAKEGLSSIVKGKNVTTRDLSNLDKLIYPYLDIYNNPTIGYGNTWYENHVQVKMTDSPITIRRAIELRNNIVEIFEKPIRQTLLNANENQVAAITSVAYHTGANSKILKLLITSHNNGTLTEQTFLFNVNEDFISRRKFEYQVYITPVERPFAVNVKGIMAKIEKILMEEIEIKLF